MQLRVATYNIHGGVGTDGRRDYGRIGQHLADLGVDIALLQEVDARHVFTSPREDPASLCVLPEHILVPAPAITTSGGWYGNALLSRFPVLDSRSIDVSQAGVEPRNIQVASVDLGGLVLRLMNTHKGLSVVERRAQFALLHQQIEALGKAGQPMVLGGDFNEWQFFSRAFAAINQVLRPLSHGATFPSRWPIFRLDRLWIGDDIQLDRCRVIKNTQTRLHSDHCPVIADIVVG